ncbi:MAG: hypothetical protein KKD73_09550 [Proteobacteria bacterium]|nr:hypothetical protein [Pseudomonadota bacterium]MBU1639415.1 hypothetical protein [Pseudomonadota bacterium]
MLKKLCPQWLFTFLTFAMLLAASNAQAQQQSGGVLMPYPPPSDRITASSYSNLSELITLICDDAMEVFWEFYGPTSVAVRPFKVIANYNVKKTTMLGITLADQMTAMINTQAVPEYTVQVNYPQKLEGVIEEIDGFLRIHMNGRNVRGERRSYAVTVEMSDPIYRALHSSVESY